MLFRAMLDAMDAWATDGTPPPASRIPRRSDGTLLSGPDWHRQFPPIPGVMKPKAPSDLPLLDWGPEFDKGILQQPPQVIAGKSYTVLVPSVDRDGNEASGVRVPMVSAPLATYAGWNIRDRGFGYGAMQEFTGSTIPFAETDDERNQTGDPRPSILERYGNRAGYVAAIRKAAEKLVADRLMIEEDIERCAAAAANWHAPRHKVGLS